MQRPESSAGEIAGKDRQLSTQGPAAQHADARGPGLRSAGSANSGRAQRILSRASEGGLRRQGPARPGRRIPCLGDPGKARVRYMPADCPRGLAAGDFIGEGHRAASARGIGHRPLVELREWSDRLSRLDVGDGRAIVVFVGHFLPGFGVGQERPEELIVQLMA